MKFETWSVHSELHYPPADEFQSVKTLRRNKMRENNENGEKNEK